MKRVLVFLIFLVLLLAFPKESLAAFSFSISGTDSTNITSKDQEVIVNLIITDLPAGDSYFRVGWESGNTYVGYIKNNNDVWAKLGSLSSDGDNQNCSNYYKISSATTSASLKIKIGNENDLPNGQINIRGERFTSSCGSYTSSDPFLLTLNLPTPSPTSTPSPTPTPSLSPSPTPTPSQSPSPLPSPTKRPSPTEAPSLVTFSSPQSSPGPEEKVLGVGTTFDSPDPTPLVSSDTDKKLPITALIFIFGGLTLVGISLYLFFRAYNKKTEGL